MPRPAFLMDVVVIFDVCGVQERERRKKMNHDVFRIKGAAVVRSCAGACVVFTLLPCAERVGKDIQRLEETIAEQEQTNERLKATLVLRQEEADIMTQILKVRDKELAAQAKEISNRQFQVECLQGDVAELKIQVWFHRHATVHSSAPLPPSRLLSSARCPEWHTR